ncbi:hypothetical protein N7447_001235 [Penicillium robsamsonii]|uniref:uncharacterized protein n=1 Tax=Penicillium robsamsonii TaxID=1792511 RepID=UPI002546D480|nr:uncharacterized protein N7447_001235 [Penicillium robsamsonii]KAJ5835209.1 hypothetical protein N7447_001235 [Penicillium robsamsonii]
MTTTPQHDETDHIVNQLAALAATVSNTSINSVSSSIAPPIAKPQSAASSLKPQQPEEESFYHLCSLITVSCLPQHMPDHTQTPSASTLGSNSGKSRSSIFDRKRASSILSLNLGDLPSLPFPSKEKVSPKPRSRYSPLPPPFVQRRLAIRPEVRF